MAENKDIILISPPSRVVGVRSYYPKCCEAMGLNYLATILQKEGYHPHILDMEVHELSDQDVLAQARQISESPLAVGIAALSKTTINHALQLAALAKANLPYTHVTLGGHLATFVHGELLDKYPVIDSVVRGEGEITLLELARALENGNPLETVEGLSFRSSRGIVHNRKREGINDLDTIPFPIRYNLEGIRDSNQRVSVCSSRGCYGGCAFCTLAFFTKKWRARSPKNVVDELQELYEKGVRMIRFDDENFLGHTKEGRERAIEIAEEIKARRFPKPLQYKILCRVDDIDEELLRKMKESGLEKISVGVESFNSRQLDFYHKSISPAQIGNVIGIVRRLGLSANFSFIMFDPYVTLDEISHNLEQMAKMPEYFEYRRLISKLKPDIGTAITRRLEEDGLLEKRGEFEYGFRFTHPEAEALWRTVERAQKKYLPVDDKVAEVKDERIAFVIENHKNGIKDSKEKQMLGKIKDAERIMYYGWVEILRQGIWLAREQREPSEKEFPSGIEEYFRRASDCLDEARAILRKT